MNQQRISATSKRVAAKATHFPAARFRKEQLPLLRAEIEMLAMDDSNLMKIAGAAALFISRLEYMTLPREALGSAAVLARLINELPEDLMADSLQLLNS